MNTTAAIDDRSWRRRRWASFGLALALIVVLIPVSQARAEGESIGCYLANGSTSGMMVSKPAQWFDAGEVITVSITAGSGGATNAELLINGTLEDTTDGMPDTLEYAIPSGNSYSILVVADGQASFDMSCSAVADGGGDAGDPSDAPPPAGDHCESGRQFGMHVSGKAKAGEKRGEDRYNPGDLKGFSFCKDGG